MYIVPHPGVDFKAFFANLHKTFPQVRLAVPRGRQAVPGGRQGHALAAFTLPPFTLNVAAVLFSKPFVKVAKRHVQIQGDFQQKAAPFNPPGYF